MKTPYEELGVHASATKQEIKAAYRKKAAKAHPDSGGDQEEFVRLAKAYQLLRDDTKRERFDQTGKADDASLRSDAERVRETLVSLFEQLLSNGYDADNLSITDTMVGLCNDRLAAIQKHVNVLKNEQNRLLKLKKRISSKHEGRNLFAERIDLRVSAIEMSLKSEQDGARLVELCLDELSLYDTEAKMMQATMYWSTTTS